MPNKIKGDRDKVSNIQKNQEQHVKEHIRELSHRAGFVVLLGLVIAIALFPFAEIAIDFLWNSHLPNPAENRPHLYGPLELMLGRLKVASVVAALITIPVAVYQVYKFISPGLYEEEKKYVLAIIPFSAVLSVLALIVSQYIVLPVLFTTLEGYTQGAANIAFGLSETLNLMLSIIIYVVFAFQMPVAIFVLVLSGLVSLTWLREKRLPIYVSIASLVFLTVPDITLGVPLSISVMMIILFEGTLILAEKLFVN